MGLPGVLQADGSCDGLIPAESDIEAFRLFNDGASNRPALTCEDVCLNYNELWMRVSHLTNLLQELGVGPECRVATMMDRGIDTVIAVLAILTAGAAFIPIPPNLPESRRLFMLTDCSPEVVLGTVASAELLKRAGYSGRFVEIPNLKTGQYAGATSEVIRKRNPNGLAYIMYTSGSSGTPKGVLITFGSLMNRLLWMQMEFNLQSSGRVLHKTPLTFDVAIWEILWPLRLGAEIIIAKSDGHREPAYLLALLQQYPIDIVHFVPSMLSLFLDYAELQELSSLSCTIICSGEVLTSNLAMRLQRLCPLSSLVNLYGPTEATIDVTLWRVPNPLTTDQVLIGKPLLNNQVYILNANGGHCETGIIGEIYIAGAQVARGYLNRPNDEAIAFVHDPFHNTKTSRMYKTGDLGRWISDGNIEFCGRLDLQVKISGVRTELGEIESVMRKHPAIGEAAVVTYQPAHHHLQLCGFYTSSQHEHNQGVSGHLQILDWLRSHLPSAMMPQRLFKMKALPTDENGKINRKQLRLMASESEAHPSGESPQLTIEGELAHVWRQLLGDIAIDQADSFFALGGNSLAGVELSILLSETFSIDISVSAIFSHERFSEQLYLIRSMKSGGHDDKEIG